MSFRLTFFFLFGLAAAMPVAVVPSALAQQSVASNLTAPEASQTKSDAPHPAVSAEGDRLPAEQSDYSVAQVSSAGATAIAEEIIVRGFDVNPVEYPALPEVQGTRINSGKKTSFVKPEEFPSVANNNYREVFATTPGLLISEEPSSPIINIGYRGLDSQRSEFTQVLKDGISIKNEQFGFPETHYTPILDALERVEFIRAGAALQFGPQPGGAVNFITKMPRRDVQFEFVTKNLYGSDELFQDYTAIDGTVGQFGYYAYYDHREREGFRDTNGDYEVNAGSAKLVYEVGGDSRFILNLDAYEEEHGEPGGLRRREAVNPANSFFFPEDRERTTRFFDRFRLKRYAGSLEYQKFFSEGTELDIKAFGGYLSRFSKRQRGGDYGVLPSGGAANTNDIQLREDYTEGAEARLRHDYALAGDTSTFAGGLSFYHAVQDRFDTRGFTPDAETGLLRRSNTGETTEGSLFAENRFHFGRLSITPGFRLEFLQQELTQNVNITQPQNVPLAGRSDFSFVPLFSLGASYILIEGPRAAAAPMGKDDGKEMKNIAAAVTSLGPPRLEIYGTFAQAYRPRTYGELVPTSATGTVNGDLKEGDSLQFELGLRGKPLPYLSFDLGGFFYTFDDQVGEVGTTTQNVGDARFVGFEAAAELDILALFNGGAESPYGKLNLYGNVTILDAEFTRGPSDGLTPAYAPDYQVKVGGIYRYKEIVKVGLISTIVDDHFASADNVFQRAIPAYTVTDLTAEVNFYNGRFGVFAGINNLFDENFYAEARDEGIVPATRRNYYGGVKIRF